MNSKTEEFLDLYKQLEQVAVSVYGFPADGTAISRLEKKEHFRSLAPKIKYCREVRAVLQHNPQVNGNFAVTPSDSMIELLQNIIAELQAPPRCMDVAVKDGALIAATKDDFVLPVMQKMQEFGYSHIPILENGVVKKVFSENTILIYMITKKSPLFPTEQNFPTWKT